MTARLRSDIQNSIQVTLDSTNLVLILKVAACAGRMVFQGPREDVVPFFQSQHFRLPARKGVADFLQEIVSPKDQEVGPDSA